MNNKLMISLLLTFSVGGVVGFFIAKKLLEEEYRDQAQIDIDDVKEYYREKYEKDVPYRKIVDKYKKPDLHSLATTEEEKDAAYFETDDEEEAEKMDSELILEVQAQANEELQKSVDPDKEPYLISYDTYIESSDVFDKVDLYFYRFDDVICDTKDVVIEDPEAILGWDFHTVLETQTTAFVRNEKLRIDYEVHSLSKSYSDEVTSRVETQKEKNYRQLARRKKVADDYQDEGELPKPKPKTKPRTKKVVVEELEEE